MTRHETKQHKTKSRLAAFRYRSTSHAVSTMLASLAVSIISHTGNGKQKAGWLPIGIKHEAEAFYGSANVAMKLPSHDCCSLSAN